MVSPITAAMSFVSESRDTDYSYSVCANHCTPLPQAIQLRTNAAPPRLEFPSDIHSCQCLKCVAVYCTFRVAEKAEKCVNLNAKDLTKSGTYGENVVKKCTQSESCNEVTF